MTNRLVELHLPVVGADGEHLSVGAILETLEMAHAAQEPVVAEGLRERKKRRLRQRISNVATALFLADGFDNVSTARIAAASEVSEQTVFNYFPTKESMFYDRSESFSEAIAEAVRQGRDRSLDEVLLDVMIDGVPVGLWPGVDEARALRLFRRFCEVADGSPVLRAAPYVEAERLMATVCASPAERAGCEPHDPEVGLDRLRHRRARMGQHSLCLLARSEGAIAGSARAGSACRCHPRAQDRGPDSRGIRQRGPSARPAGQR